MSKGGGLGRRLVKALPSARTTHLAQNSGVIQEFNQPTRRHQLRWYERTWKQQKPPRLRAVMREGREDGGGSVVGVYELVSACVRASVRTCARAAEGERMPHLVRESR